MGPILVYLLAVTLLACGVIFAMRWDYYRSYDEERRRTLLYGRLALSSLAFAMIILVTNACVTAHSVQHDREAIVVRNLKGEVVQVSDTSVWKYGKRASFVPTLVNVQSSVQPITENPKVRRFRYEVKVMVTDPGRFIQTCGPMLEQEDNFTGNLSRLRDTVNYQLYEFNNAKSKELASLYNPLDPEQKKHLENMLQDFMGEKLKSKGIAIELLTWSVE